jgi:hypothetical protein
MLAVYHSLSPPGHRIFFPFREYSRLDEYITLGFPLTHLAPDTIAESVFTLLEDKHL